MQKFDKLKREGLSMFRKAISNLEESSTMMYNKEVSNNETIDSLKAENEELSESRQENNNIIDNIKKIIGSK